MAAHFGHRAKVYEDAVAFPASKAAAALTITGTEYHAFEDSGWGGANIVFSGDTVSGDTMTANTYVSFDKGTNWVQVDNDTKGHYSTWNAGGGAFSRQFFVPMAPRVRVDIGFDASATLPSGHGCKVNIEMLEYNTSTERTLFENVLNIGDTQPKNIFAVAAKTGTTLEVGNPSKLFVWRGQANAAKFGDTLGINVQGSTDSSIWYTITALSLATRPVKGDSVYTNAWEIIERPDLPKYVRLQTAAGDSDTFWETGHGTKFYVTAFK